MTSSPGGQLLALSLDRHQALCQVDVAALEPEQLAAAQPAQGGKEHYGRSSVLGPDAGPGHRHTSVRDLECTSPGGLPIEVDTMPAELPYMNTSGNIGAILERIKTAGTPPKFTNQFLQSLGFTSSN